MNQNERPRGPPSQPRRMVTITYFVTEMLGLNARQWYYNHKDDPGMPQRVFIGGRTLLLYDECVAYVERLISDRPQPPPKPKVRRHRGRPARQADRPQR